MTEPLEIVYDFESAAAVGTAAVDFWSALEAPLNTLDLLVDLLLVETELRYSTPPSLSDTLRSSQSAGGSDSHISSFVSGVYEQRVHAGARPHIEEFSELPEENRRDLKGATDPFHLGQQLAGRFYVEQRIGQGTFGVVFKVHDQQNEKKLACKTPHEAEGGMSDLYAELLANEAIAMEKLAGQGCPSDYEMLLDDGHPLLVMQFVEGRSLREVIADGTVEPMEAARILSSVARTVALGHENRIVHRDLKPENVLLDDDGHAYVVDFGLVLFGDDEQFDKEGEIAGTRDYIPPDALLGATHQLDGRADIYAIGIMLYELLVGSPPRRSHSREEALVAAVTAASVGLPWPDSIPQPLQAIGQRCVQANPLHRYSTALEVAYDLESFLRGESASSNRAKQLFAWDAGLLLGKFNHMHSFAEHCMERARFAPSDDHDLRMALATFFGSSEAASDLLKQCQTVQVAGIHASELKDVCDRYPKKAAEGIRSAFYTGGRKRTIDEVQNWADAMKRWIADGFDVVQSICEAEGVTTLARFEFGFVAAQAENKSIATLGDLRPLAEKTEIPESIWSEFVQVGKEPSRADLPREFLRLSRDVRHFLQGEETSRESSS